MIIWQQQRGAISPSVGKQIGIWDYTDIDNEALRWGSCTLGVEVNQFRKHGWKNQEQNS